MKEQALSPVTPPASTPDKRGDLAFAARVVLALSATAGAIVLVQRLLHPPHTVLATLPLENGVGRAEIRVENASDVRVLLNVRALVRMDRGDLSDDLERSKLTLSTTNPVSNVHCAAFDGWSSCGNDEKSKRVPRFKEAENTCVLKAAPGKSVVDVKLEWKGKSQPPKVTALLVTR